MCVSASLLVLDEMDQLDSKAQDVLYTIFEWPYLPKSRLCLIGELYVSVQRKKNYKYKCRIVYLHPLPYERQQRTRTNSRLTSRCSGIANALDLTDRILPRLQAKPHCRPQLLHFPPYSRQELAAIVQDRLTPVKHLPPI